jgi:peptidoglycan hydrolase-like protein with peptidoglycan-binding domain
MSDTWASDAERFNKFHAPAGGPTGGQFAAASGSSAKGRPTPSNEHPVGQGETSKRVSDLQERLNAGGFKPPLKVDGIFGPKTLAAVRAFQMAHGL